MSTSSEVSAEAECFSSSSDTEDALVSVNELSDELECIGVSLPKFTVNDEKEKILSSLVYATWNLIQLHHAKIQELHRPDEVIYRLTDDCKILRAKINHLKDIISKKDHLLQISAESERRLKAKNDKLSQDLKKEHNEVRRLLREMQELQQKANREARNRDTDARKRISQYVVSRPSPVKSPNSVEEKLHSLAEQNIQLKQSLVSVFSRLSELCIGFSSLIPKKKLSLDLESLQSAITLEKETIDFVLEDCNASCSKHLNFLEDALQELLSS